MAEKVILEVEVKSAKAGKDIKKVGDGSKSAAKETTLFSAAIGGVRKAMLVMKATSKLLFSSMKMGLISTGLGIFIVLIGSLVSYLMNTKAGAEKLEQVLAGVGAIISVLTDRISMIGGAIAKVFSGDFAGAAGDVKAAMSGIGDEILEEAAAAMELKRQLQELADSTREFNLEKAETRQAIAKALLMSEDESLSNEERLAGLKQAMVLEEANSKRELELQTARVAAIEAEVKMGESLNEDLDKLSQERIKLVDLETASIKLKRKVLTEVNAFEIAINSEAVAKDKKRRSSGKSRRDKEKADTLKVAKDTQKMLDLIAQAGMETQVEVQQDKLRIQMENKIKAVNASKAKSAEKTAALAEIENLYQIQRQAIIDKAQEKIDKKQDGLDAKQEARELKASERLIELTNETSLTLIDDLNMRAIAQINIERRKELAAVEDTKNSAAIKAQINAKYNRKVQAQNKATSDANRKFEAADLAALGGLFGQAASMQTEGTEGWKENKIAEARIGSITGAMSAFNSMASIPFVGVALGIIAAGLALQQGQKQVDEINATEIPKMATGGEVGGYGTGTSDSVNAKLSRGEIVINAKSAKMFRGALSAINVAGGGVGFARGGATSIDEGGGLDSITQEPVKAYVITDDLTSSQDKLAQIRRRSRL